MANLENVKKWTDALRSGKYTPNYRWLGEIDRDGNETNCAAGVAYRIFFEEKGIQKLTMGLGAGPVKYGNYTSGMYSWLGFEPRSLYIKGYDVPELNQRKISFSEIADMIDAHFGILPKEDGEDFDIKDVQNKIIDTQIEEKQLALV